MRVLGLDLGRKRIGVAVSDEEASIAFPSGTIQSRGAKKDLQSVLELIEERAIGAVVIGLPRHLDGREGPEAAAARAFATALHEASGLPVETLDERWTTVEAERVLHAQGHKKKRQRAVVDSVAASIILGTYLDLRRNREAGRAIDSGGPGGGERR
jgi:putative Holliday junction resolvase